MHERHEFSILGAQAGQDRVGLIVASGSIWRTSSRSRAARLCWRTTPHLCMQIRSVLPRVRTPGEVPEDNGAVERDQRLEPVGRGAHGCCSQLAP
ncbi:MAG: hypothetical protein V9G04_14720 [Nocardioides sp.]